MEKHMVNKAILFTFILLATLSNAFAFADDPKVFQILHDNNQIACAKTDQEYAFCWEPFKAKFLKLQVNQAEIQKLQQNDGIYCHENASCCDLSDSSLCVSTLRELVDQISNYNNYRFDSKYFENRIAKIRALGAAIYMYHGHSGMVDVCNKLPTEGEIRRLVESLWDSIGDWLG